MVRKMAMTVISIAVKIMLIVAVICLLVWGGKKGFEFGVSIFTPSSVEEAPGKDVTVTIKSGAGKMDVGKLLEEKVPIRDLELILETMADFAPKIKAYRICKTST